MNPLGRLLTLVLLFAATSMPLRAGVPEAVDDGRIPAYKRVSADLATAGQPTPAALAELETLGFRTIVNLRTAQEGEFAAERATVESQGLRYVSVPMTAESFSLADLEAVEKVLADPAAGPVLLHCHSANRAGGVWAAIQARRGRSLDEALAAGQEAGLRSPAMVAAVRRVLGLGVETAAPPAQPPARNP